MDERTQRDAAKGLRPRCSLRGVSCHARAPKPEAARSARVRRTLSPLRRVHAPPLVLFALLSASLHVGVFAAIRARASHPAAPAFDPASQTLAGETLDVEPPGEEPGTEASETPEIATATTPLPTPGATLATRLPAASGRLHAGPPDSPAAPAAGGARATLFGAVG